jgi:methylaspartate mutase epsilon subunit
MDVAEKRNRLRNDEFYKTREVVLNQWPTGKGIQLEDGILYQKKIPKKKQFSRILHEAKGEKKTLIQPRAGVALVKDHIELLKYLSEEGEADLLPTTIDSYTRQNRYEEAETGIQESMKLGRSLLNGFPAVNHGIHHCREVTEAVEKPVQVRHGTPDARLLAEITLAGGFTSFEGGGISYNIPYAKDASLEKTVKDWMYVDRLVGLYEEAGVTLNREPFGPLTGTLVPPCISHSVAILESLLAAEQGVKNITVGYGQCGNLIQDVAAIKTLEMLTEEYLRKFNYQEVEVTTVLHQWMGGFPQDEARAFGVISWGATVAGLSGATKVIVKSPHEAMGVPTKEANSEGLRTTKQIITMLSDQEIENTRKLQSEIEIIQEETRSIVNKALEMGKNVFSEAAIGAIELGIIDIPFAPSKHNAGKILPVRDDCGAIRILEKGNIPLKKEVMDFHRAKIDIRAKKEKRMATFQMVIDDIYAIGKGYLVGRPT